jgi:Kef-type K+ transport system membrane component KefB
MSTARSTAEAPKRGALARSAWLIGGYAVLAALVTAATIFSLSVGRDETPAPAVAGTYTVSPTDCLGKEVELEQSGQFLQLHGAGDSSGKVRLQSGHITGDVTCGDGSTVPVDLAVAGPADARTLSGSAGDERLTTTKFVALEDAAAAEPIKRTPEDTFARLMLAIAAVILAARFAGALLARLSQPRVMGEVLAGILLGPTLLGAVWPEAKDYLFPRDIVPLLSAGASIGLAFYLFLVGMELDVGKVRRQLARAAFVSNASVAVPMSLGLLAALPVYKLVSPDVDYVPFALFMGVSMSITAFPVLARILVEKRMLRNRVGVLAMAGAAIDDVTAWGLLALATAVAGSGEASEALVVVALAAAFTAAMLIVGKRLLGRAAVAYDEVGHLTAVWLGVIIVGVLLSAYTAGEIGIAPIFGAFVMGLIMPRHAGLTEDVNKRIEDFVVLVLLPLFFVVTGLKTDVGSIDRAELWLIGLGLLAVAIVGKWVGAMVAARISGMTFRDSAVLGALMNTRGLTELIVLNIGLDLGLISPALFTILVLMALVTTFMAGPALRLLDPKGQLSEAPERALRRLVRRQGPRAQAERSILVAPLDDNAVDRLVAIAEPLARSEPPRELLLVRLMPAVGLAAGLSAEDRELRQATTELAHRRELLEERGVEARAVAFTSPSPGQDLLRLANDERVDLILVNGRRPIVGDPVPRGEVGALLAEAPCDVAVLVEREGDIVVDEEHPVVVPFGGSDHDWAALELGAWIASAQGAPLRLLGAASTNGERDASRLLANASLVVQQLAGVSAEPLLVTPGKDVIEAAQGAGLLLIGLSERWQAEGMGPLRIEIARRKPAPTLFVRRGRRPGALAPAEDMTRFRWSTAGPAPPAGAAT